MSGRKETRDLKANTPLITENVFLRQMCGHAIVIKDMNGVINEKKKGVWCCYNKFTCERRRAINLKDERGRKSGET